MSQNTTAEHAAEISQILASMEEGSSLRKACKEVGITSATFLRWVDADEELQNQYARARARLLDVQAEELEEIGEQAARAETAAEVAGLRLQSDNRKWLLSKLAPKKYGEKLEIEQRTTLTNLTEEQIDARIAKLYGSGGEA
ncbi:MAG TPA: hypothetical protein VMA55_20175 [Acidovorax sp.]|nr:hypothetical protein [Acidovorax sp.]